MGAVMVSPACTRTCLAHYKRARLLYICSASGFYAVSGKGSIKVPEGSGPIETGDWS